LSLSTSVVPEARHVWKMARNCAMSPLQFLISYCLLAIVSLSIACLCAASGGWVVLFFAIAELAFVAVLFVRYARHAADYDRIDLSSDRLLIEHVCGSRIERYEFNPLWARVCLQCALHPKIEVWYEGKCVLIGAHVPEHQRQIIVAELRRSMRGLSAMPSKSCVSSGYFMY
jgi:uncharacterized membrane protein